MPADTEFHLQPSTDAIIAIDIQNDFVTGALPALPVPILLPSIFSFISNATKMGVKVWATRDWHPNNHCSFEENGGRWVKHCVAGSWGADFVDGFPTDKVTIVNKGFQESPDAYSGFMGTALKEMLVDAGVKRVFLVGYCTEYCVMATAEDSIKAGFETVVLIGLCGAVDEGDAARAVERMKGRGILVIQGE